MNMYIMCKYVYFPTTMACLAVDMVHVVTKQTMNVLQLIIGPFVLTEKKRKLQLSNLIVGL